MAGDDHLHPGYDHHHQPLDLEHKKPYRNITSDQQVWTDLMKNNQRQTMQERGFENGGLGQAW